MCRCMHETSYLPVSILKPREVVGFPTITNQPPAEVAEGSSVGGGGGAKSVK